MPRSIFAVWGFRPRSSSLTLRELGPMVGLSELIVDIVETGRTLKENKLVEVDSIYTATARLIANRVSFKLKFDRLDKLVRDLRKVLDEEEEQCK